MPKGGLNNTFSKYAMGIGIASFIGLLATLDREDKTLSGVFATATITSISLAGIAYNKTNNKPGPQQNNNTDDWDDWDDDDDGDEPEDGPTPVIPPYFGKDEPESQKEQIQLAMNKQTKVIKLVPKYEYEH